LTAGRAGPGAGRARSAWTLATRGGLCTGRTARGALGSGPPAAPPCQESNGIAADQVGMQALAYNAEADRLSWQKAMSFLAEVFGK